VRGGKELAPSKKTGRPSRGIGGPYQNRNEGRDEILRRKGVSSRRKGRLTCGIILPTLGEKDSAKASLQPEGLLRQNEEKRCLREKTSQKENQRRTQRKEIIPQSILY